MATIALLGKVTHSGDVTIQAEGQPVILGQVTLCCEVVVLGTLPSLAEPRWNHHQESLVSLPVMLVLSPCCMCTAASISLT
jgi:hypothetical protein